MAGTAGGLKLVAPEGSQVRPTSDRVREAMFNALFSLGVIEGATVLDLFAGSGALGIEALSRGAGHVTFVEKSPAAIASIEQNLATTDLSEHATVRRGDATTFISRGERFDIVLLDPPYGFDDWPSLLDAIEADLVVIESNRTFEVGDDWRVERQKSYGTTVVTMLSPIDRPENR